MADLKKLEGGGEILKKRKKNFKGSGGHSPPDAEGYFQFNTTFVPGFCVFE